MDGLRLALIIFGIVVVAVVYLWTARRRRLDREAGNFDRFDAWTNEELDPLAPSATNHSASVDRDRARSDHGRTAREGFAGETSTADELTQPNFKLSAVEDALGHASVVQAGAQALAPNCAAGARHRSAQVDSDVGVGGDADPGRQNEPATKARQRLRVDGAHDEASDGATSALEEGGVIGDLEAIVDSLADSVAARAQPRIGSLDDLEVQERRTEPKIRPPTAQGALQAGVAALGAGARQIDYGNDRHSEHERDELHASAEMVVVLNVMARAKQTFDGPSLKAALDGAGLKPGEMQLYHYRAETQSDDTAPIFSALNAVKPGTLDESEFDNMHTPGIALILRMPGLERPSESFELMLVAARRIAGELNGQVCDDSRSTLTGQALNHLRERIAAVAFRPRSGG